MDGNTHLFTKVYVLERGMDGVPLYLRPEFNSDSINHPMKMQVFGIVLPNPAADDERAKVELASCLADKLGDLKNFYFCKVYHARNKLDVKKNISNFRDSLKLKDCAHAFYSETQQMICIANFSEHSIDIRESLADAIYRPELYVINDEKLRFDRLILCVVNSRYDTSQIDFQQYLQLHRHAKIGEFFGSPDFGGIYYRHIFYV